MQYESIAKITWLYHVTVRLCTLNNIVVIVSEGSEERTSEPQDRPRDPVESAADNLYDVNVGLAETHEECKSADDSDALYAFIDADVVKPKQEVKEVTTKTTEKKVDPKFARSFSEGPEQVSSSYLTFHPSLKERPHAEQTEIYARLKGKSKVAKKQPIYTNLRRKITI